MTPLLLLQCTVVGCDEYCWRSASLSIRLPEWMRWIGPGQPVRTRWSTCDVFSSSGIYGCYSADQMCSWECMWNQLIIIMSLIFWPFGGLHQMHLHKNVKLLRTEFNILTPSFLYPIVGSLFTTWWAMQLYVSPVCTLITCPEMHVRLFKWSLRSLPLQIILWNWGEACTY